MRNKVQLYIEGLQADLDNNSFLLLNYTMEDLSNPTIVKNSFSRQITLKGTPRNDEIFGHIYRNDRDTLYGSPYTGPQFDPTRKTSFVIYNEMMEVLESGYLKLDEITINRKSRNYKVTLYGGLGSFLYGISYKPNGDKMSLADLDFGETLDFTIDRGAVADAWARLDGDTSKAAKWEIINFAPAYNGKPGKPFDANKGIVHALTAGLPDNQDEYTTLDGKCLVTLDSEVTEQEAKDYRSYLQRPVIKMSALIDAICDPANNGGWTVNQDAEFFDASNPYWADTWLTLPMLSDLNIDVQSTYGEDNISFGTFTIPGGGNLSKMYAIRLSWDLTLPGGSNEHYVLHCEDDWAAGMSPDDSPGYYLNYLEFEVIAKDANNAVIKQFTWRVSTKQAPEYMPQMDELFDYIDNGYTFYKNGLPWQPRFSIDEYGVASVTVNFSLKALSWGHLNAQADANLMWPDWSYDYGDGIYFDASPEVSGSWIRYTLTESSSVRTGASITQARLLSGDKTPADYLLSFCKLFGFQMLVHKDSKTVDLVLRKNLYNGSVTDIGGRIDRAKGISKKPFAFDARWYLFGNEAKGEFAEYYANKYGRPFGQFRVNTGYDFDASQKNLTDGIIFQNGCEALETSKFFCDLTVAGNPVPSVFLGGGKFTLFKGGETKDFDLPQLPSAFKAWVNSSYPMHDKNPLMQFHGEDNAHQDGRDVLLLFDGMYTAPDHTTLSDDTRTMLALNGNNPCWMPGWCDYDAGWLLAKMPRFGRYRMSGGAAVLSLDWGNPLEVQIPGITMSASAPIFPGYWEKYIADRYDDDSAVITAYVDLRGLQVNEDLFRNFYAFDGALWALNRIIDHSLTTIGPTKCEFVKVQDSNNYTSL